MRNRLLATLLGVALVAAATASSVTASPAEDYRGPYFGENNLPPGCSRSAAADDPTNICHRMRTGLNALDSPQVDVVVMVPVSPTAERDMRIMRQSVEMWEAGIDHLAEEMNLDWLAEGVDFHVSIHYIDPTGANGGSLPMVRRCMRAGQSALSRPASKSRGARPRSAARSAAIAVPALSN